jgi:hypothetical protein
MKSFTAALVSAFALLPYVAAHGSVSKVVIDGKEYAGNTVNSQSPSEYLAKSSVTLNSLYAQSTVLSA